MIQLQLCYPARAFALFRKALAVFLLAGCALSVCRAAAQERIPNTEATALDGRTVVLPRDLPGRVCVLILGFGRHSADPTTAWEKPVRTSLEHLPEIGFLDMPVLASAPKLVRGWIVRAIRNKVPEAIRSKFVPINSDEDAWRRAAGYDDHLPDAPYVLLVDRSGVVRWTTHEPYTPERFGALGIQARRLLEQVR